MTKGQKADRRGGGLWLSAALLLAAAGFIALGVYRGEAELIWQKAVNICLECIGIG